MKLTPKFHAVTSRASREITPDIIIHELDALNLLNRRDNRTSRQRLREQAQALLLGGRRYYKHAEIIDIVIDDQQPTR